MNINKLYAPVGTPVTYTPKKTADGAKTNAVPRTDTLTLTDEARSFLDRQKNGEDYMDDEC